MTPQKVSIIKGFVAFANDYHSKPQGAHISSQKDKLYFTIYAKKPPSRAAFYLYWVTNVPYVFLFFFSALVGIYIGFPPHAFVLRHALKAALMFRIVASMSAVL